MLSGLDYYFNYATEILADGKRRGFHVSELNLVNSPNRR